MMTTRPGKMNVIPAVANEMALYDPPRLRRTYDWLTERFQAIDLPVSHVGYTGNRNYGSLPRVRKRVGAADWGQFRNVSVLHVPTQRKDVSLAFEYTAHAGLSTVDWGGLCPHGGEWLTGRWRAHWAVDCADAGLAEQDVLPHLLEFARLTVDEYGYLFYMRRMDAPTSYASGSCVGGSERNEDQDRNLGEWRSPLDHFRHPLLRDIYPYNFLTRPYLNLPVHGTTLEGWIRADAGRGTLEPLTDKVTTWRPVLENIPALREALFRAGVMYYWRFFTHDSECYRMTGPRPFAPDEPIPEIFRADFYAGRDPRITQ